MNESQKHLIEEWFSLSEEELFTILALDESTEEQMENAIIVLESQYGYTQEGIIDTTKNIIGKATDYAKEKVGQAVDYAKEHPYKTAGIVGGLYAAKKLGAGKVLSNMKDTFKNNLNPFKKDKIVHSLDDFLDNDHKEDDRIAHYRKYLKQMDDDRERKNNQPLKTVKPEPKESYEGTTKMQKSFTQFREELVEQYFIEDLDNESLVHIIEGEEFSEEEQIYSVLELVERGIFGLNDEEYCELKEASLVSQKTGSAVNPPSTWDKIKSSFKSAAAGKGFSGKVGDPNVGKPVSGSQGSTATKAVQKFVGAKPDGKWGPKSTPALKKWATTPITPETDVRVGDAKKDEFRVLNQAAAATKKALPNTPKNTTFAALGKSGSAAKPAGTVSSTKPVSSGATKSTSIKSAPAKPSTKPVSSGATKTAPTKSSTKLAAPVRKALPSNKPSAAMNDLRQSVDKLRGTASAAATATNRAKTALSKVPGTGRMNKPTSRGGMSSSDIHSGIAKLGGEPTRAAPRSTPTLKVPAQTKQGAPRASSSRPPAGGKWIPQNSPSSTPVKKTLPVPAKTVPSLDLSKFRGPVMGQSKSKSSTRDLF